MLNAQTKRVTGLSVDFAMTNFYGMLCYAVYTTAMRFSESVRDDYASHHNGRSSLIATNDVVYATHAAAISVVLCGQIAVYRRRREGPSITGLAVSAAITLVICIGALLVYAESLGLYSFVTLLSAIKIILTVLKYIPQVMLNWRRRSTIGWSIRNVVLDFAGGLMSISQLLLDAYIASDPSGIRGAAVKLLLGAVSMSFDVIFLLQHYYWFPAKTRVLRRVPAS